MGKAVQVFMHMERRSASWSAHACSYMLARFLLRWEYDVLRCLALCMNGAYSFECVCAYMQKSNRVLGHGGQQYEVVRVHHSDASMVEADAKVRLSMIESLSW